MSDADWILERTQRLRLSYPPEQRADRVTLRWERAVDPGGVLRPEERRRRADRALRRHMKKMAKVRHGTR